MNKLVYGKDTRKEIVGIELGQDTAQIYYANGSSETEEFYRYMLFSSPQLHGRVGELGGRQPFKYFQKYSTKREFWEAKSQAPYPHFYAPKDDHQMYMLKTGTTMYKGMKYEDLKILSFDIETNGLTMDSNSVTYLICATTQHKGVRKTVLFSLDDYETQKDMIEDFCSHVQEVNPHAIAGHYILGFDLPFLQQCYGRPLPLGREGKRMRTSGKTRQFRKDGHRSYDFNNIKIYGREVIDTKFLAMKYDFQNKYNSYSLKPLIEQEGLIEEGRQFYDAATIKDNWEIPAEREKIKKYCKDDAVDALNLCDLMLPNYFYYTQTLPMGIQEAILTASGSQVNAIMVRSYLQDKMSIPRPSESVHYQGAISFGNPGLYSHVNKVDVASLYPSIILQYNIYDRVKDPQRNFVEIVRQLTEERLDNKRRANETGERYYRDMEQAQKILINSAYGFMGAPGLNFNSPQNAARITQHGREILQQGIDWVETKGFTLVNVDTDSFSYTTGKELSYEEFLAQINDLNSLFEDQIIWEDDGMFRRVIIVKAKNYVLQGYDVATPITIKGSGLKATMKEPALKEFIEEFINRMLNNQRGPALKELYDQYALEIMNVTDIDRWSSKKTVTKAVLNPKRTTEQKIFNAIKGKDYNEGDRIHIFFDHDDSLRLNTDFLGTYSVDRLLDKLFKTVKIFETVMDMQYFPNYKLKKNKNLLNKLTTPELKETSSPRAV